MHGTRGTTGSEDCLLLYSGAGNSLILPTPLFHLPNSKPGSRAASLGAPCYIAGRSRSFPGDTGAILCSRQD